MNSGSYSNQKKNYKGRRGDGRNRKYDNGKLDSVKIQGSLKREVQELQVCFYGQHKVKCYRHSLENYTAFSEDGKKMKPKHLAGEEAAIDPAKSTRQQQRKIAAEQTTDNRKVINKVAGRTNDISLEYCTPLEV